MDPVSPAPPRANELPKQLGRYRLLSILGEGGMAQVYRAELLGPAGFRKPVALKLLKAARSSQKATHIRQGLVREARLGGLLKHPNIVDIYELGEHNGAVFIAMELVSGLSLRTLLKSRNELPLSVMLQLSLGIASGLDRAHAFQIDGRRAGLVHRDLKPSNILVSWNAEVKIADFGIAVTQLHQPTPETTAHAAKRAAGTPAYMSPEQSQGRPLDARSDLFSFGLVIFEMAIGRRLLSSRELAQRLPKAVKDKQSILKAQEEQFLNNVLPDLGTLVARCLQPLPGLRYPSARAVEIALEKLQQEAIPGPKLRVWLKVSYPDLSDQLGTPSAPYSTLSDEGLITSDTLLSPLEARSNLGPNMDDFIGRDSELELLSRKVHEGARLITLKGTGGGGKTRLSQHFARQQLAVFASGTWFVDLTECRTALSIVHALSRALDIPLATDWELDELVQRTGHALSARGSILLILDNFEQITSHAQTTLAKWLELAPSAVFLVTTRERLRLRGEHIIELAPLPHRDALQLFHRRAIALGAKWDDTTANQEAIEHVVQELDGIPLAIELAASRSRHLSPTQLQVRINERFKLFGSPHAEDDPRQTTLWGLIHWSWALLKPWEQSALAQLSVFRGGFSLESAEAVLDLSEWPKAPWVLDVIGQLLDKSLLVSREVNGQPRFHMYVSIADFARHKRNETESSGDIQKRHAHHFSTLGTLSAIQALNRHGGAQRLRQLNIEVGNCMAAAHWAIEQQLHDPAVGCTMAAAKVWLQTGPFASGVTLVKQCLTLDSLPAVDRHRLHQILGELWLMAGHGAQSLPHLTTALTLARELEDRALESNILNNLGGLYAQEGRFEDSKAHLKDALEAAQQSLHEDLAARAKRNLAVLHRELIDHHSFIEALESALRHSQGIGDRNAEALNLANLAVAQGELGDVNEAEQHFFASLTIYRELGNRRMMNITQGNLANLYKQQGRLEAARRLNEQALVGLREVGDRRAAGNVLCNLGNIASAMGDLEMAAQSLTECIEIALDIRNPRLVAVGRGNLGDVLLKQGQLEPARQHFTQAIDFCSAAFPIPAGAFMGSLALVEAQEGRLEIALQTLDEAESLLGSGNQQEQAKLLCKRGKISLMIPDRDSAIAALEKAEHISQKIDSGNESELGKAVNELKSAIRNSSHDGIGNPNRR